MRELALVLGIALLAYASDFFVVGVARLASALRMPPVLVGTLVIGFGTSLPELFSSVLAASQRSLDVAIGSIVGSDTVNATLVVGLVGVLAAPKVGRRLLRREAPIATAAVLLLALAEQVKMTRLVGLGLLGALVLATAALFVETKAVGTIEPKLEAHSSGEVTVTSAAWKSVLGLVGVLLGAEALVWGSLGVAAQIGLSGSVVGVVILGLGTSLPEVVVAVQACRRGHTDLVLGNVLGANLFNSLGVGAVSALVKPQSLTPAVSGFPTLIMVLAMLAVLLAVFTGRQLRRFEGAALLVTYLVFVLVSLAW